MNEGIWRTRNRRSIVAFVSVIGVLAAMTGVAVVAAPQVYKGAQTVGPFTPTLFQGDLRQLPRVRAWKPGDAIKEIPRRNMPTIAVKTISKTTRGLVSS